MATRQYIGARYVPKFYQNSVDGSTQWESNVVYEPLMYVTLTNGHMYISKKQVPATVGSPVNNIDYWLDIGSYNGFIEQLQNEIDDINNVTIPDVQASVALKQDITDNNLNTTDKTVVGAINELDTDVQLLTNKISAIRGYFSNKKVCFYGDSLITVPTNYVQYLNDIDDSIQITNRGVGGTTVGGAISLLTNATDLDTFDVIVLAYGTNSWTSDETINTMLGQYQQCFNIINTKAPNTKIICVTPFYSYWASKIPVNGAKNSFHDYVKAIIEYCTSNGIPVIDFYSQSGVNKLNYSTWLLDSGGQYAGVYVHENDALAHKLAQIFIDAKFVSYEADTHTVFSNNNHDIIVATRCNGDIFLELIGSPILSDVTSFTLPESYRPAYLVRTICMVTGGNVALLTFNTDGTISCSYTSSDPADQISATPVHFYNRNYYSI